MILFRGEEINDKMAPEKLIEAINILNAELAKTTSFTPCAECEYYHWNLHKPRSLLLRIFGKFIK